MTGPDYPDLERVVPGPEYPEVRNRSGMVVVWMAAVLVIVAFVLSVAAAASRGAPESSPSPSPAEPASAGREGNAQALLGTPQPDEGAGRDSGTVAAGRSIGVPPTTERYRGTATWYCLSGSSACTRGYSGDDLVAAIDTDLGFAKGDAVTVRYRDRAVTVTVVDVCACPGRRLIDLTSGAFSRLAPLGHGVIPVTVELAGPSSTLPPTHGETP